MVPGHLLNTYQIIQYKMVRFLFLKANMPFFTCHIRIYMVMAVLRILSERQPGGINYLFQKLGINKESTVNISRRPISIRKLK